MNKETVEYWSNKIQEHPVLKGWTICDENEVFEIYPFMKNAVKWFNRRKQTSVFLKKEDYYRMVMYTDKYVYYFLFHEDYMSCGFDRRIELPLESHKRGGDLTDGKANKDTLFEILCDIMSIECVKCPDFGIFYNKDDNRFITDNLDN